MLLISHAGCSFDSFDTSYGHGNFGRWINDEFELPAYHYTGCDAAQGNCVATDDAFHQLGNDAANAVAHSAGHVELFTARTFYRFANKYDESAGNYAGGFGWVRDGDTVWSTLEYDLPQAAQHERIFGMGYYQRTISHDGLVLKQRIYMPAGDDEALLEHMVFTNETSDTKTVQYIDYWDVAWVLPRSDSAFSSRREFDPATVVTEYEAGRATIKAVSQALAGDPDVPDLNADPSPKVSFVTYIGDTLDNFDTVQADFFGDGDRTLPARVRDGQLGGSLSTTGDLPNQDAVLVSQKSFTLAPGESRSLRVLYGLAERGRENQLIDRYRAQPNDSLHRIAARWRASIPRLALPEDKWLDREMAWNYYYLKSGLLREEFFDARVINQGSIYLYQWGANAGPRATLRHLVPLIYIEPSTAKESLVYHLRAMKNTGAQSYATSGYGAWNSMGFHPSDSALWLLWAATEYVNATRDFGFLNERYDFWCQTRRGQCGSATAYDMFKTAFNYQVLVVGRGPNGLIRLLNSDWDDGLTRYSEAVDPVKTFLFGESTMNTAMALFVYPRLAEMADRMGDTIFATWVRNVTQVLRAAMQTQWRDNHFTRAQVYSALTGEPMEVGTGNIWLASNGMALLADNLMTDEQAQLLVDGIAASNSAISPGGMASQGPFLTPGTGTPGNWLSLSGPTIEGLLTRTRTIGARELAWTEFKKQTLANHATKFPQLWYGIWSGPDMYLTPLEAPFTGQQVGETWCLPTLCMGDFPVTNMFTHSESLTNTVRMAGVWADSAGYTIDPGFPFDEFTWDGKAMGVAYNPSGAAGWVRALGDDTVIMRVRVPQGFTAGSTLAISNDRAIQVPVKDGFAQFQLRLRAGRRALWAVAF
ncbi:MAG: hypothetical protein MJE77_18245 [Proteobacteria bacterium]|nr:hypothetical protein [Pseudomonadota bacterium]